MKSFFKNVHVQGVIIAVIFVSFMVGLIFWLDASNPPYQREVKWVASVVGLVLVAYSFYKIELQK
jgi:hypothetical protein